MLNQTLHLTTGTLRLTGLNRKAMDAVIQFACDQEILPRRASPEVLRPSKASIALDRTGC